MTYLLAFLPDEFFILIIAGLAFLVMFQIVSIGRALGIIFLLGIIIALTPIISSLMEVLPIWVLILILFCFIFAMIRFVSGALLGKGVSDHVIGSIVHDLFLIPFRIIRWFIQIIARRARA